MKTMGLSDLRLVRPEAFPSEVALARASGATDVLAAAKVFDRLSDALADCVFAVGTSARGREFVGEVLPVRQAVAVAMPHTLTGQVALVFGTEMSGMTNAEVECCQVLAYIPSNPAYSSLNLGSAVQVAAYEVRLACDASANFTAPTFQLATHAEIAGLMRHFRSTLIGLRFFNPAVPKRLFPRLARLFNRTRIEREEVDIFRGVLNSIDQLIERKK